MSKLTKAQRNALPASAFAIPNKREYPIPDRLHARLALDEVEAHGTPREQAQVRAAVKQRFPGVHLPKRERGRR